MEGLKFRLGFECCLVVDCERRSGGIALLWKKDILLSILNFSKYHIHASVKGNAAKNKEWILTGIYGNPDPNKRYKT